MKCVFNNIRNNFTKFEFKPIQKIKKKVLKVYCFFKAFVLQCYCIIISKTYFGGGDITDNEYMDKKFEEMQKERVERLLNTRVKKYDTAVTIRCKATQKYEFDKVAEKMGVTSNELHRYAMQFVIDKDTEDLRNIVGKRI